MFRANADDHVLRLRVSRKQIEDWLSQRDFTERQAQTGVGQLAGKKFIAGEPMKPATNRLAGRS